jgi:glutamyl-Q tRNA(Asp) synthetase
MIGNVTRFAPSPTGYLHLGHAWSALFAHNVAQQSGGRFLLRIEDIDPVRCKLEFTTAIYEDLRWLGLIWEQPVRVQSQHMTDYADALARLKDMGVLYPCFCSRREIIAEVAASGYAPHAKDAEIVYPGTCRHLSMTERTEKLAQQSVANWRLDTAKSSSMFQNLKFHDHARGVIEANPMMFGDVVLARKDVATSYHLSVTVDDHLQGVSLITRGEDLFASTHIHRVLQALLGYYTPDYHHHHLLTDANGKRYAKRDNAVTIRALREFGNTPADIRAMMPDF